MLRRRPSSLLRPLALFALTTHLVGGCLEPTQGVLLSVGADGESLSDLAATDADLLDGREVGQDADASQGPVQDVSLDVREAVPCEVPGEPCDDGSPCTTDDRCDAALGCVGRRDLWEIQGGPWSTGYGAGVVPHGHHLGDVRRLVGLEGVAASEAPDVDGVVAAITDDGFTGLSRDGTLRWLASAPADTTIVDAVALEGGRVAAVMTTGATPSQGLPPEQLAVVAPVQFGPLADAGDPAPGVLPPTAPATYGAAATVGAQPGLVPVRIARFGSSQRVLVVRQAPFPQTSVGWDDRIEFSSVDLEPGTALGSWWQGLKLPKQAPGWAADEVKQQWLPVNGTLAVQATLPVASGRLVTFLRLTRPPSVGDSALWVRHGPGGLESGVGVMGLDGGRGRVLALGTAPGKGRYFVVWAAKSSVPDKALGALRMSSVGFEGGLVWTVELAPQATEGGGVVRVLGGTVQVLMTEHAVGEDGQLGDVQLRRWVLGREEGDLIRTDLMGQNPWPWERTARDGHVHPDGSLWLAGAAYPKQAGASIPLGWPGPSGFVTRVGGNVPNGCYGDFGCRDVSACPAPTVDGAPACGFPRCDPWLGCFDVCQ